MKPNFSNLLLVFCIFTSPALLANDDDDDEILQDSVQLINGQVTIHLPETAQKISAIQTQSIEKIEFQPEFIAYGQAISASPLLTTLNQYRTLISQRQGANGRRVSAEKALKRLRALHQNDAVSSRKLQNQLSLWQSEKAIADELTYKTDTILNNSRLQWGEQLTQWLMADYSSQLNNILTAKASLLRLSLPVGNSLDFNKPLLIHPAGLRDQAFVATPIGLLPSVDQFSQGFQYLLYCDNPAIKAGMNFTAWLAAEQNPVPGYLIPKSAVSWHLGQAFIFLKINDEHFIQHNLDNPVAVADAYFINTEIDNNALLVTQGAQMLLSHQFRSQIPDEDDD